MDITPAPHALVTGGSRGLGLALVRALVARGWRVTTTARDGAALRAATADLGEAVTALPGDVTDPDHRPRLAAAAGDRLDVLVNNAGALGPSPLPRLADVLPAAVLKVLEVNTVAPLALIQAVLPALRTARGAVVNVTSDAAVEAYEGWGVYGATKAALEHLTAVLAVENPVLSVYAVDPGDLRTRMHADAFPGQDISDRPLPESVVPAFLRLLGERPPSGRYRAPDLLAPAGTR